MRALGLIELGVQLPDSSVDNRHAVLILGASGMAGTALLAEGRRRGLSVVGASRSGSDLVIDLEDMPAADGVIRALKPALIINTVAEVDVGRCEADPGRAWRINARPAAYLAALCKDLGARLVHVSTDHFFSGDGSATHAEDARVTLCNEYARTKFAAESLAMTWQDAMVVRTNIVGMRPVRGGSFAEWCLNVIRNDLEVTLFNDQFVSCVDVWTFASAVFDLNDKGVRGIVNVASRDVFSKAAFALALADAEGKRLSRAIIGSVGIQATRRPDSLGLDVTLAESIIGRPMPTLGQVVASIHTHATN